MPFYETIVNILVLFIFTVLGGAFLFMQFQDRLVPIVNIIIIKVGNYIKGRNNKK